MVLGHKEAKEKFNIEKYDSLLVLDLKEIKYHDTQTTFGYNIEILNVIRELSLINKICTELKSDTYFNTDILHDAIDHVFNETMFSDKQSIEYFKLQKQIESFIVTTMNLIELDHLRMPFEIDFLLLGMQIDVYTKMKEDVKEILHENYADVIIRFTNNKMSYDDFIKDAKKFLN